MDRETHLSLPKKCVNGEWIDIEDDIEAIRAILRATHLLEMAEGDALTEDEAMELIEQILRRRDARRDKERQAAMGG